MGNNYKEKMQDVLVTIVVPIYNTEKYLNRCMESIVNQTYKNLEIIMIDDGSPDHCPQMCDEWAMKDRRIQVVHKQNQGLGMARNSGIESASGQYICFFDSDDYVSPCLVERAISAAVENKADVVHYGYYEENPKNGRLKERLIHLPKNRYCGREVQSDFLPDFIGNDPLTGACSGLPRSAWGTMYSMELIKRANWNFVSEREILSEDIYSNLMLYRFIHTIAIVPEPLYYYCLNESSLSREYRADRFEKTKDFYRACLELCVINGYSTAVSARCMDPFLASTIAVLKQELSSKRAWKDRKQSIIKIINDALLQDVLRQKQTHKAGIKQRILFWAIQKRWYGLVTVLIWLKNRLEKIGLR